MSKPRKTPVPLPGSKTKTPIPASSTKKTPIPLPGSSSKSQKKVAPAQLSQEFVDDSGDSSDEGAATGGAQQQKAPVSIAVHRPKSNGVAAKAAPDAKKKQKDASKSAPKEGIPPKKPAPKQVVQEEDGASDTSDSDSSEDDETDIKQAQQREAAEKKKEDTDSSSDVSSDSSDESEDEPAPAVQQTNTRPTQAQTQTVTFQQARPFVPPEDFNAISTDRAASSACTNVFKNLNGKQIWHITAPENVPLKDLTRLAMNKARNGEAVLEHKGTSYGFAASEDIKGREVLIPTANGYKAVPTRISQAFHVQQVINLPKLTSRQADQNTGSEAAASITASTIRSVKPQVKGLKMRFFPSGFQDSAPATMGYSDSEDDEAATQPAGLGIPKGLDPPAKKEKRKHSKGAEEMEAPAKKHKKQRTEEEQAKRDEKKAKKEKKKEKKAKS